MKSRWNQGVPTLVDFRHFPLTLVCCVIDLQLTDNVYNTKSFYAAFVYFTRLRKSCHVALNVFRAFCLSASLEERVPKVSYYFVLRFKASHE